MSLSHALSLVTPERGAVAGLAFGLLILGVLLVRAMNWARKWKRAAGLWHADYTEGLERNRKLSARLYEALMRAGTVFDEDDREKLEAVLEWFTKNAAPSDFPDCTEIEGRWYGEPYVLLTYDGYEVTLRATVEYLDDEVDEVVEEGTRAAV